MGTPTLPWNYAAGFYLELIDLARERDGASWFPIIPRKVCAALLLLRSCHEAHASRNGIPLSELEPAGMCSFVFAAKNAIIHDGEALSFEARKATQDESKDAPADALKIWFSNISIDLRSPEGETGDRPFLKEAERFLSDHDGRVLDALRDALLITADMIGEHSTRRKEVEDNILRFRP